MIAGFPKPYPDELLYSRLCRYHVRSGNSCVRFTLEDVYRNPRKVRPDYEFFNPLNEDARKWIFGEKTAQDVILQETMFPVYGRFLPVDRRVAAFDKLALMENGWNNHLAMPTSGARCLRYCPVCVETDRRKYGETYWHRSHGIPHIDVCPEHGCRLVESDVKINNPSKLSPNFYDAESCVSVCEPDYSPSSVEKELASYAAAVMTAPMNVEKEYAVGRFLNTKLGAKYRNKSGLLRKMDELYADLTSFGDGLYMPSMEALQKLLNGYRFDYYYVCLLGMFLHIPPEELASPPEDEGIAGTEPYKTLCADLSRKYGVNKKTAGKIVDEVLTFERRRTSAGKRSGQKERLWAELDDKTLPSVVACIDELEKGTGRPVKLTYKYVTKKLCLPERQLNSLPKCREYVRRHVISQPEHWARSVAWAVRELQNAGELVSVNRVCRKLNIQQQNFAACFPFLSSNLKELFEKSNRV